MKAFSVLARQTNFLYTSSSRMKTDENNLKQKRKGYRYYGKADSNNLRCGA